MKILSWNCQGLGNGWTIGYLRELWKKHRPDFLFLAETKQNIDFVVKIQNHLGYDNLVTVDPNGLSGGLALFFNKIHKVTILFQNERIIDIQTELDNKRVYLTFVYGDPIQQRRDAVWERITRIGINRSEPWFIMGDFNELTGNHEKQGGKLRHQSSFTSFNNMIRHCGLLEFPCLGNTFSWRGNRSNGVIRCKLDRAMANEDWHEIYPFSFVEYLAMVGSDHRPICATVVDRIPTRRRQFRFDQRWIGKDGLMEAITKGWETNQGSNNTAFVDKIRNCRHEISVWRKNTDTNEAKHISDLQKSLEEIQNDDARTHEELLEVTDKLKKAYWEEEVFWKQKSRNTWLREGDSNTKFFHAQTKQRRARNRITGLYNKTNVWITQEKDLTDVAVNYFKDLFTSLPSIGLDDFLQDMPSQVTESMNAILVAPVTEKEVRKALFMMHPGKAPGPDGMTALFFQKSWQILKSELVALVDEFFKTGTFDKRLNMTNICLIPKKDRPNHMTDFRPISLCNVGYKIISKILCQRLKKFLPSLISETQSAFVSGRVISDNILIAQEMFHALRTNKSCKGKFMAIKTDMSKAYDRVEWSFVDAILRKMGFAEIWISWIMQCIQSVSYKVLINGCPKGQIMPKRGLRQGDPLSPYLFILCTEALITNLRKAEKEKMISGLKISRQSPPVSHLLFADDSLFFCKATKEECLVIVNILKNYEKASGQQINFSKSSIQFGHEIPESVQAEMKIITGISSLGGMGNYLGLPESMGGSKTRIFSFVRERLENRINGWSSKFLSKGGKEVLIKSVATALPTYVMSCFKLPKTITTKLSGAIAKFWWSSDGISRGLHWKSWDKVCTKKSEGGLGFRVIEDFNTALLAKQLWRLLEKPESLLARVLKGRYYRKSSPLDEIKSYSASFGWRSIVSARSLVKKGLIHRVGSGRSISVWDDPWLPALQPRPATCIGTNYWPSCKVSDLIDPISGDWKWPFLLEVLPPEDVELIKIIPCLTYLNDTLCWQYTKSGKYTVKSGYHVLQENKKTLHSQAILGPTVEALISNCWNISCPPKLKHFMWQILTECISVMPNLRHRGIKCDTFCMRCGYEMETTNHVFFECPPARQVWLLSAVQNPLGVFPTNSKYSNLDYLFWRQPEGHASNAYPWLLWYIWKSRNDKVFSNIDWDPRIIVKMAESEAKTWELAQNELSAPSPLGIQALELPLGSHAIKCFVDASWKASDSLMGLGWTSFTDATGEKMMGARAIRRSESPLHAEIEALLWAMEWMASKNNVSIGFYSDSMEVVKMVSNPEDWPTFSLYLHEVERLRGIITDFSIFHVSRSLNSEADSLARGARMFSATARYVNSVPPTWMTRLD